MKAKAVISTLMLCALALSASGCDGADLGTDNLIRPRKPLAMRLKSNSLLPIRQAVATL